jgi:hypothetical protein
MELSMKDIGEMTYKMAKGLRLGQMDRDMMGSIKMERNMEEGLTLGVMGLNMLVNGSIIK